MYTMPHCELSLPTSTLMSQGGDDRITIDERSGLNAYGCAPSPMTSVMYSSSTASAISADAYRHVQAYHFRLRQRLQQETAHDIYAGELEEARSRIRAAYRLSRTTDIAFGPSGTDLEYLALALALQSGQPVCNLVVEVEEVGSGCQFSQAGKYFAPRTAQGKAVAKGDPLPGFAPERISVRTLKMRSDTGPVQGCRAHGEALSHAIAEALERGQRPLLHVIHRSKTGIIAPDLAELDALSGRFGGRIDVVVDACQGRISPDAIEGYLRRGAMVFITGSKFFGGPPFSAFALVPPRLSQRMNGDHAAPTGLADFFALAEMPGAWRACRSILPRSANFGMLLRLEAALFEIGRFFALPDDRAEAVIKAFNAAIGKLGSDLPFQLVDAATADDLRGHDPSPLDRKMLHVVELTLPDPHTGKPLDFDQARALYRLLYHDISAHFANPDDILTASEICHLGQPVRCLWRADGTAAPTLRFALSAPLIASLSGLDREELALRFHSDIERVGRKLRLAATLLQNTPDAAMKQGETLAPEA